MKTPIIRLLLIAGMAATGSARATESVARSWNEQNLAAIRIDFPAPTVHARNLFHASVAMWDAWAAYEPGALGYLHRETATAADVAAARDEAISYAAFRVLSVRYLLSTNAETTTDALRDHMTSLGYDPFFDSTAGDSPAALGNRIGEAVLDFYSNDNSNEANSYTDFSYVPKNQPLILEDSGTNMTSPNRWQPLAFDVAQTQNGQIASDIQIFVGSQWGQVRPFAMSLGQDEVVHYDPGMPPQLGTASEASFKEGNLIVLRRSRDLDPDRLDPDSGLPVTLDISPGAIGNNTLGQNDGTGHSINPSTGTNYASNVVPLGDYGRVLAEFWADGPASETPPGHWNTLANEVVDHPDFEPRIGGTGPLIDQLEWDVKMYFALNAALHDAAVAAWGCKRVYDYVRPISSIRHMAVEGILPLEPDLVEEVTATSSLPGGRHAGLTPGKIAVLVWGGEPDDPENEYTGNRWIHAEDWLPYQRDTFVTPAFAGYVSGHSCFSRAAAEVLTRMTGSVFFPGGLGTFTAHQDEFLEFEQGPSVDVVLQWATYYDAADEAGISRLYGGIHVPADDGPGRVIGSRCGIGAYELARTYFDRSTLAIPVTLEVLKANPIENPPNTFSLNWTAQRGLNYQLDFSYDLRSWAPALPMFSQAEETGLTQIYSAPPGGRDTYFRVRQVP